MRLEAIALGLSACLFLSAGPQAANPAERAAQAGALVASGKATEAIPIYQELLRATPGNAVLHLNLAIALFQSSLYRDAIEQSRNALSLEPGLTNASLFLGASHLKAGEPAEAIEPLKKVLAARPGEHNATLMLAEALLAVERNADAVARFLDASQLLPTEARVWYGIERGCEAVLSSAVQGINTDASESSYGDSLAGDVSAAVGRYAMAVEHYKHALASRPNAREVWQALAHSYRESGHPDWAEQAESRRLGIPASDCEVNAAACAFEAANYSEAFRRSDGTGSEKMYWRAKACRQLGGQAIERLSALGDSPQFHEVRARRLDQQGLFAESARHWSQASNLAPGNPKLKKGLALALYRSADFGGAVIVLKDLIALDPDSRAWNSLCGDSLLLSERPAEALPYFKRALELGPHSHDTEAALGRALLQLRRFDEAIPYLEAAAKSDPDAQLLFQLARAYSGNGQNENATRALEKYKLARASELDRQQAAEGANEISPP